jgi:hypothetical protein
MPTVVLLNVVTLSAIMLSVNTLNVVAPRGLDYIHCFVPCIVVRYISIYSVPYDRNYYDASKARASPLEVWFTFTVQATIITIVNYNYNMFIGQAKGLDCSGLEYSSINE